MMKSVGIWMRAFSAPVRPSSTDMNWTSLLAGYESVAPPLIRATLPSAGFLSDPKYGGNDGQVGWRHIGFTPAFAYQPPFGDYDAEVAADHKESPK